MDLQLSSSTVWPIQAGRIIGRPTSFCFSKTVLLCQPRWLPFYFSFLRQPWKLHTETPVNKISLQTLTQIENLIENAGLSCLIWSCVPCECAVSSYGLLYMRTMAEWVDKVSIHQCLAGQCLAFPCSPGYICFYDFLHAIWIVLVIDDWYRWRFYAFSTDTWKSLNIVPL